MNSLKTYMKKWVRDAVQKEVYNKDRSNYLNKSCMKTLKD